MLIGIDSLEIATPDLYLDMTDLAVARGVDPAKFHIGLGQDQMAVAPASTDAVTLAARAAAAVLARADEADTASLGLVVLGTESAVDASKAMAVMVHGLLGLPEAVRAFDIREACYAGTAGLMTAVDYVAAHPGRTALVIASDLARYGLGTGGEPTQGAGAAAMLVRQDPRLLVIDPDSTARTEDVYDFWRPEGESVPRVDGHLSNRCYTDMFARVLAAHRRTSGLDVADYAALCFHLPYTKMGRKALAGVLAPEEAEARGLGHLYRRYEESLTYSRRVGNCYTASLYLGLASLLDHSDLRPGDRLGLFSYGSGAVGELVTATVVEGFRSRRDPDAGVAALDARRRLGVEEYEAVLTESLEPVGEDTSGTRLPDAGPYALTGVVDGVRRYRRP
ncbi:MULTISPECIES: hydroxymethylglutaryl-CoA synthase [unclassified Actinomyces]|uniref:hydroxymethylglutaryl-CoA synthase n=1 Tax=unclassified Actinomyces TaxID=2609248 RepID=UPI002016BFD7|nr:MULTISPECIES: hydroxymethylglutaryl-CoA synthase [unclassified Actinomyces]MCL3778573.1 hydroxymethylglutaryl-CoA synthase [Actinomyces sp. AC-20-1]MCL3789598.1 hydroxymethylglutaryl-CoA synthase [Actinomyces sp. 187325]MCL3792241.1 hydroxymethylglutaryl-CoA synthase [Actinomyces sp. 186855]MCL3794529.1 hydroxymethylglutaryl-CoA synthase [Actinomyces sp. 217892]